MADKTNIPSEKELKTSHTTGQVKWFKEGKGFGFIVPDDGGDDLPVHHSKPHDGLLVQVYVSKSVPIDNVADGIAGLYRALNKYHICCRGRGLTIEDWHLLVPASESIEVPV
jgi:hypothetical protein